MHILFDPDFDLGAWPGPRGHAESVAGATWRGPDGLLSLLETGLGLGAPHASLADRAAALVPRLFRADRFYAASAKAAPWATAQRLLVWRDHLWEHGWRGEGLGERRLGELAEVTAALAPGRAERLELVAGWLEARSLDIAEIRLLVERATLSSSLRRVLAGLERGGTRVTEGAWPDAIATGNLSAVRDQGAEVAPGDRSLQLFRPHGPRQAAEAIAAALAADPGAGETLFIAPDGMLDEALAEFGLPTLGARSTHGASALTELLPMTLELAWSPVDPQLALEWLALPDHPLPRSLARRLAEALDRWPSVGSPAWRAVVDAELGDATERTQSVGAALDTLFVPLADRAGEVRARDLLPRVELLERWATLRAATSAAHEQVVTQARALRSRFRLAELNRLTPPKLDAVLASVVSDGAAFRRPAQAGYSAVGLPGGMAGPARRVIWWNFLDTGSPRRARMMLRASEHEALGRIGVELPALGDEVRAAALRARRPLRQTVESLILVAPQHDEAGEPAHPHPLWDEIVGKLCESRDARHLRVDVPNLAKPAQRTTVVVVRPEAPTRARHPSLPVSARPVESPTSLTKLLGCSFAYGLEYLGRVRSRSSSRVVADNRLHGRVAHEVLAAVARAGALSRDGAEEAALAMLARLLPTHAALLLLPGHQHDQVLLRDAVRGTAALLGRLIQAEHLQVRDAETEMLANLGSLALKGTPDLVLTDPTGRLVLLDFKWSGEAYHREELRRGTALQLSAYATLLRSQGLEVRALGYLILRSQRLIVRGDGIAFAQRLSPELLGATWDAAERAWRERVAELARAEIYVEGVRSADHAPIDEARLDNGRLVLPPGCRYCGLDLLCGLPARTS